VDEPDPVEYLAEQGNRMREAGTDLAVAAARVIRDHDGVHRLAAATAKWFEVLAEQGRQP
jgi:hypothetical protein